MEIIQDFEMRLAGLEGRVLAIRSALSGGSLIEMTVLDRDLRELCLLSERLPLLEARRYRNRMVALLDDLTSLEEEFRSSLNDLGQQIANNAQRHRATQAYGTPKAAQR